MPDAAIPLKDITDNLTNIIAAMAALGTASFALVDGSKAFWGGVSNTGFVHIKDIVKKLFPSDTTDASPVLLSDIESVLKARWLNGAPPAEQKATAKSLIKLRLNEKTATDLAKATGVDADKLGDLAQRIAEGKTPQAEDADLFNRFDLMLTTIIDQGYQRADQAYRNTARVWSIAVSVALAVFGGRILLGSNFWCSQQLSIAFLIGLAATPVAPFAKDLTSALSAGVKAAQMFRK